MICEQTIKIFCNDFTKIENYEKAIADIAQTWQCHHRLETHNSDGTERPKNAQLSKAELIALGMYYNRPAEELIFLTEVDHKRLHNAGKKRIHFSEEWKRKMSEAHKGKHCKLVDGKRVWY